MSRRRARLERALGLAEERIAQHSRELADREVAVVQGARVVLAAMTNVYMSRPLQGERYGAAIFEEAGMAILPTLFHCASLARGKAIMVGDPKQLPPIVHARDAYVHQAMGRSILAVAAPRRRPPASPSCWTCSTACTP